MPLISRFGTKVVIGGASLAIFLLMHCFNASSTLHFTFDQEGELYNYEPQHQQIIATTKNYAISKVFVRRRNRSFGGRLYSCLSRPSAYILQFKNTTNTFDVSFSPDGSTSSSAINEGKTFAINANFYDHVGSSIGEVVVDHTAYGRPTKSSGFFKVIDGKVLAGPRSLFAAQDQAQYACQAHPSVMKNGRIWDYILNESKNKDHWSRKTYRSLVGMDTDGNVVFIVSGNGGLMSVKEVAMIARANSVIHATMLDAGSALQYAFESQEDDLSFSFSASNNKLSLGRHVERLFKSLTGRPFFAGSPVFINYSPS